MTTLFRRSLSLSRDAEDAEPVPTSDERMDDLFLPDLCGVRALFMVVIIGELLAIGLTLARVDVRSDIFGEFGLISSYTQWIVLSCAAVLCLARRPLSGLSEPAAAALSYGLVLAVSYGICELAWWVVNSFVGDSALIGAGHSELLIRTLGISAIVGAVVLRHFYLQHQSTRRMVSETRARMEALQARIRPHFLFNCMNVIASLTRSDPVRAEQAVEDLADLFRASLADVRGLVSLDEEIRLARRYLSIEALRLGERLTTKWDTQALPKHAGVPLLTLQPLLENAIYHGIEPLAEGGAIEIIGETDGRFMTITISNPVSEQTSPRHAGNRLAQDNVRQRIAAHFGAAGRLDIDASGDRYRVSVILPIREHDDAHSDH